MSSVNSATESLSLKKKVLWDKKKEVICAEQIELLNPSKAS